MERGQLARLWLDRHPIGLSSPLRPLTLFLVTVTIPPCFSRFKQNLPNLILVLTAQKNPFRSLIEFTISSMATNPEKLDQNHGHGRLGPVILLLRAEDGASRPGQVSTLFFYVKLH